MEWVAFWIFCSVWVVCYYAVDIIRAWRGKPNPWIPKTSVTDTEAKQK